MLIEGEHTPQLEEAVKATFPPDKTVRVPFHFTQLTGKPGSVTYLFKSVFWRRLGTRFTSDGREQNKKSTIKAP